MAAMVAAVHFALAVYGSANKSATYDEMAHVTGGYAYWKFADYRIQPENGNWSQRIVALPVVLRGAEFPSLNQDAWTTSDFWAISRQFFFSTGNDSRWMLGSARKVVAVVGAILCLVVFYWSRNLWGYAGAWVSLILVAFSPNLLAHAGLATSDVIAATFFIGSMWALWAALERPRPWMVLLSVALAAGAVLAKYSAVVLIPAAFTMLAFRLRAADRKDIPRLMGLVAAHVVGVIAIIWMSYSLRYSAFNPKLSPATQFIDPWSEVVRASSAVGSVVSWSRRHEILPEAFLYGLATVDAYSQERSAFLNGVVSQTGGWRWFFPYAALVKTTLPSLLLLVATPVLLWFARRRRIRDGTGPAAPLPIGQLIPLFAFIGWYWLIAITSHLNIGHRHLIPVAAATAILLGAAGEPIAQLWRLMRTARAPERSP